MPSFGPIFGKDQSDAVHAFVIQQAWKAYGQQQAQ
jgi:hypothetical protein